MNPEFNKFLETGKIIVFPRGKELVKKELAVAQNDLDDAKAGFETERYKWLPSRDIMPCSMLPEPYYILEITGKRVTMLLGFPLYRGKNSYFYFIPLERYRFINWISTSRH
jgi:hypothetical protein